MTPKVTAVRLFKSLFLLSSWIFMSTANAIEEPAFQIVSADGDMEIRHYAPMLLAEVTVDGDLASASSRGFRLIANYIFGNNQGSPTAQSKKINMTAPVAIEPKAQPVPIAMTAPVTVSRSRNDFVSSGEWKLSFVMPRQYSLATIPRPNNKAISLREEPDQYFAVYKYSGFNSAAKVQMNSTKLLAWIADRHLAVLGACKLSRYDPPWTLPFLRRNEIMVQIGAPTK